LKTGESTPNTTFKALLFPPFWAKSLDGRSSLCNLCVLCVSVVDEFRVKPHHRDTEDTEVAQRNPKSANCLHKTRAGGVCPTDTSALRF